AAIVSGPALGTPETVAWSDITDIFANNRRVGAKDGPNFVPARFTLEADGRQVRRMGRNVVTRTMVALDCETHKDTGEVPPALDVVMERLRCLGLAGVAYTSHSHTPAAPRYRVLVLLSEEIAPQLSAPEILADDLGLAGVLDRSKLNPASLFYLPSASCYDDLAHHEAHVVAGTPYSAARMREKAGALRAARQTEQDRIAAVAHAEAQQRLQERIAAGFDPEDSLIEKLRQRLDLPSILRAHNYDTMGSGDSTKYRHAASESGSYGADIKVCAGIPRVFSHNGGDPLHGSNLPDWCTVTAVDAFDATVILDFGGDRKRALRELAVRFGFSKPKERKALARLLFRLIRQQAPQEAIQSSAYAEGLRLGMTRSEVIQTARWVCVQATIREAV
ncbi:MAG TPA: hypothetical protein VFV70_04705, partial [Hyphomonadaceae bacterium]|nr:hypothetical protein [Hyphomonadaceae bacterium]